MAIDDAISQFGLDILKPAALHSFLLYLDGKWYGLFAKPGTYDDADPIGVLDVDISSRLILDEILGIKDLRSDKRIDFVGGLRGLGELKRRVDSGEMKMALALHPVRIFNEVETVVAILAVERIARMHVFQLHGAADVAGAELVDLDTVLSGANE